MKIVHAFALTTFTIFLLSCGSKSKDKPQIKYNSPFLDFSDVKDSPSELTDAVNSVVLVNDASGFFISEDGLLMTNNHVLGESSCPRKGCINRMHINMQRGSSLPYEAKNFFFEPKFVDGILDFAIYQVYELNDKDQKDQKYRPYSFLPLKKPTTKFEGSEIFILGHPALGLKKYSKGKISHLESYVLHMTAYAVGGNSGGPIVNSKGELLGIVHSSLRDTHNLSRRGLQIHSYGSNVERIMKAIGADDSDIRTKMEDEKNLSINILSDLQTKDAEDLIANKHLFYASRTMPEALPGMKTNQSFLDFLIEDCKDSLDMSRDKSISSMVSRISTRCLSIIDWTNCQEDENKDFGVCPDETTKAEIKDLASKASARIYDLNASIQGWKLYKVHYYLETTKTLGDSKGREAVKSYLNSMKLPLTMELAALKIFYDSELLDFTYQGTDLVAYVKNFRETVSSPSYYLWVLEAAQGIYTQDQTQMSGNEFGRIYESLLNDENVSFRDFCEMEKKAYLAGYIH